ncbi:MAG: hypothetical protein ACLTSX_08300 [Collinsella sp.]
MADDGGSTGPLTRAGAYRAAPETCASACPRSGPTAPSALLSLARSPIALYIDDHALGNLLLVALAKETDSVRRRGIRTCERLLGSVLAMLHPSTLELVSLLRRTREG